MPTLKKDLLFDLIKSLTKAEKRNFRLYAKKIQQNVEVLFLQLFDYLEKRESFDVNTLLKDLPNFKKNQIANLKRNLYNHILISLRLLYSKKQIALEIREFIDYAEILYSKGLYLQSLKILARAKKLAIKTHQHILHLEIVAFESRIESRHITRSSTKRMSDLMTESVQTNKTISRVSELSNLKLYLQRVFINHGHLKTIELKEKIKIKFIERIGSERDTNQSFFEQMYYYQSYYWFYYLEQNFQACYEYTLKWADLYVQNPTMVEKDIDMYLRTIHHVLNSAFFIKNEQILKKQVTDFEVFIKDNVDQFSLNAYVQAHLFLYQSKFNQFFLQHNYEKGLTIIPEVLAFINAYEYQLDNYKIMILNYKIASCYLGSGQPDMTVDYLNKIINYSGSALRDDILLYARILLLLAHYELENDMALEYLTNAIERQINNIAQPDKLSKAVVVLFKKLFGALPRTQQQLIQNFQSEVAELAKIPTEKRAFIFLDLNAWAQAKLMNKRINSRY